MGFVEFKIASPVDAAAAPVKASLAKVGKAKKAKLQLTLSTETVTGLKWSEDSQLQVMLGDGDDQGKVRIRPKAGGTKAGNDILLTKHFLKRKATARVSSYFRVSLGHVPQFVNRREGAQPCEFTTVDGDWLEIVLPAWSKDEPSKPISGGGVSETIKTSPNVLPKWKLLPSEEDITRYLAARPIGEVKPEDLLQVLQLSNPDAKISDLSQSLGRIRRKLDPAGLTIQQAGGGFVNLLGERKVLFTAPSVQS